MIKNKSERCQQDTIYLKIKNSTSCVKVFNENFKALIELNPGKNSITIKQTQYSILPLYIICDGHDGTFQGPPNEKRDVESALGRITLGTKLIQSVFAEKMHEEEQGRKTFHLKDDCQIFHSKLNYSNARRMSQDELWTYFAREITHSFEHERTKFLGFLSCTEYCGDKFEEGFTHDDIVRITEGYVALGGGGLALFGTACLYTWPERLSDVVERFLDCSTVDRRKFMDDSCYRGTLGACFSTTLGSVLHELCHTFDLGHTNKGIMGRGFDDIYKVFIINETKNPDIWEGHRRRLEFEEKIERNVQKSPEEFSRRTCSVVAERRLNEEDGTFWTKSCVIFLAYHKWFNSFSPKENTIKFDCVTKFLSSTSGLRVIEIRNEKDGMVVLSWIFDGRILRYSFQIPNNDLEQLENDYVIYVEDSIGNILKHAVNI